MAYCRNRRYTKETGQIIAKEANGQEKKVDTDADRYPTLTQGLRRLLDHTDEDGAQVQRVDIRWGAGGECYYRKFIARADEHDVGYIPSP